MSTTLERPATQNAESTDAKSHALGRYRELVITAAEDAEIDSDELIRLGFTLGKNAEVFQSDVEVVRSRKAAVEAIEQSHVDEAKGQVIQERRNEIDEQVKVLKDEFDKTVAPLMSEYKRLEHPARETQANAKSERAVAVRKLRESSDPSIDNRIQQIGKEAYQLQKRWEHLKSNQFKWDQQQKKTVPIPDNVRELPIVKAKLDALAKEREELEFSKNDWRNFTL